MCWREYGTSVLSVFQSIILIGDSNVRSHRWLGLLPGTYGYQMALVHFNCGAHFSLIRMAVVDATVLNPSATRTNRLKDTDDWFYLRSLRHSETGSDLSLELIGYTRATMARLGTPERS
jgi:hypothetical protein